MQLYLFIYMSLKSKLKVFIPLVLEWKITQIGQKVTTDSS